MVNKIMHIFPTKGIDRSKVVTREGFYRCGRTTISRQGQRESESTPSGQEEYIDFLLVTRQHKTSDAHGSGISSN